MESTKRFVVTRHFPCVNGSNINAAGLAKHFLNDMLFCPAGIAYLHGELCIRRRINSAGRKVHKLVVVGSRSCLQYNAALVVEGRTSCVVCLTG